VIDPDLKTFEEQNADVIKAVAPTEYEDSCFDRGHQVPSADRDDDRESNRVTFFMSNIIPQTAFTNRIIWKKLENYQRDLIKQGTWEQLLILAGPIYHTQDYAIGPYGDIPVPTDNFKIIVPLEKQSGDLQVAGPAIAVIIPNITSQGLTPDTDQETLCLDSASRGAKASGRPYSDWRTYQVTVKDIESRTGIDFSNWGI
jgi:endonuclease G